jgi:hypothetical protein
MNNMLMPGFAMPGGFPPGLFNQATMQAAASWGAAGDDRSPAPIRRGGMGGGSRYNNRSGPYDRRPGAQGGWSGGGRGGRGMPAGGRWGDGAGGNAAVGPREAIQGRTIKSYEDLDQVSGGGSGELNY